MSRLFIALPIVAVAVVIGDKEPEKDDRKNDEDGPNKHVTHHSPLRALTLTRAAPGSPTVVWRLMS